MGRGRWPELRSIGKPGKYTRHGMEAIRSSQLVTGGFTPSLHLIANSRRDNDMITSFSPPRPSPLTDSKGAPGTYICFTPLPLLSPQCPVFVIDPLQARVDIYIPGSGGHVHLVIPWGPC